MRSEALRNLIRKPRILIAISHGHGGGGMEHGGSPDFGGHDGGYGDEHDMGGGYGGHDMGGETHPGAKDEMSMRQDAHDQVLSGLEQLAETYPAMKKLQRQFEGAYAKAVSGKGAGRKPRAPKAEKPPVEAEAEAPSDDIPADGPPKDAEPDAGERPPSEDA